MDLRYPIGKFEPVAFSQTQKQDWLIDIAQLPNRIEAAIENLDKAQLDTPYRPDGWTVAQVVHHLADSHINAFCRIKLVLTGENPFIQSYQEDLWVRQADAVVLPINNATTLLHALHQRMYELLKAVPDEGWERSYTHSDTGQHNLWHLLGMYAWHGRHHLAHITTLKERMEWR